MLVAVALEVLHCTPEELVARLDDAAQVTGRGWVDQLAEIAGYYHAKEVDRKRNDAIRALGGGVGGLI